MFTIVRPMADRGSIARSILEDLPDWFGIPETRERYIARAGELPMIAAVADGAVVGFLSLEAKTAVASEIHVFGVRREFHRRGIGRALVVEAENDVRARGHRYLVVKTVSARRPDRFYEATRGFYEAVAFVAIDELPDLWGPENPCLVMIKPLEAGVPKRAPIPGSASPPRKDDGHHACSPDDFQVI